LGPKPDARGFESIAIALLLGTLLAALALGLGIRSLANVRKLHERGRAVESFNAFVERARIVSIGAPGNMQWVELDLPNGKIIAQRMLLQLAFDGEVRRSEILPLRMSLDGLETWEIGSGYYSIELQRGGSGEYHLKIRRL